MEAKHPQPDTETHTGVKIFLFKRQTAEQQLFDPSSGGTVGKKVFL